MKKFKRNVLMAMLAIQFSVFLVFAQAPQAIPYQAAARNSNGVVIAFKTIGLRFTVLDTVSSARNVVYQETMPAITNALGLFMVNIGQGQPITGTFSSINWGATANMYVQVEMDTSGYHATGQSIYVVIGTQQLMSVPYALYANTALNSITANNGVPVGTIEAFAGDVSKIPTGWKLCDGSSHGIYEAEYANLFNVIGWAWGGNAGTSVFNLPETRGLFLRGQAHGLGWDPNRDARTAIQSAGNTGDNVGSVQSDDFKSHDHFQFVVSTTDQYNPSFSNNTSPISQSSTSGTKEFWYSLQPYPSAGTRANSYPGSFTGGNETRPVNVYVNYIIKL